MAGVEPNRVALVVNPTLAAAKELAEHARRWWQSRGYEVLVDDGDGRSGLQSEPLSFAVSLGGDGTMLRTVQLVLSSRTPVLGVNTGNLGYLTQVEPTGIERAFERLVSGQFEVEERLTLDVTLQEPGGEARRHVALNEVVVERNAPGRTIRVAVSIAGRPFLTYAADGVIVATPTGSTAYNFSARGPIMSPRLGAIVITPISPHMLFDRSLVLDPSETVAIALVDGRVGVLSVDGSTVVPLAPDVPVEVAAGRRAARVVRLGAQDFHAVLRGKFGLSDR